MVTTRKCLKTTRMRSISQRAIRGSRNKLSLSSGSKLDSQIPVGSYQIIWLVLAGKKNKYINAPKSTWKHEFIIQFTDYNSTGRRSSNLWSQILESPTSSPSYFREFPGLHQVMQMMTIFFLFCSDWPWWGFQLLPSFPTDDPPDGRSLRSAISPGTALHLPAFL